MLALLAVSMLRGHALTTGHMLQALFGRSQYVVVSGYTRLVVSNKFHCVDTQLYNNTLSLKNQLPMKTR